jgi:hypothetical protein
MRSVIVRYGLASALFVAALGSVSSAAAAVDCGALSNRILVVGSSAVKPILAEIAKVLVVSSSTDAGTVEGAHVIYSGAGSCVGVDAILNSTPVTGSALSYWDDQGNEQTCSLDPDGGTSIADIGVSDVFVQTCRSLPVGLPSNVQDFLGPVQTMTFVAPHASTEASISAEAAYYVFGFGAESGVEPWTDPSVIFQRNDQSGTQRMIAAAIRVDASLWKGMPATSSSDLRQRVIAAGGQSPQATIGILASDEADDNRATLNVLAYQHYGQSCGFYPDRDALSNEKQNVRDGHYMIWGPMHMLSTVDAGQHPVSTGAGLVIGYLQGSKSPPGGLDLIYLEAQRHVVPECAMRVARSQEMGPITPYSPSKPCGCYYEKSANGSTSCQACTLDEDCGASGWACSYNYCEPL